MVLKAKEIPNSPIQIFNIVRTFEEKLSKFQQNNYAFATNSATSALFLSALALGIKSYDKIITAPISWPQTYLPFAFLGCNFIVIDYMKEFPIVNYIELKDALKKFSDTKAVLIPILYGIADGIKEISSICKDFNVPLIIDGSQGLYSIVDSKPLGFYSDVLILSFSFLKDYGYGEGGAILTNSSTIYDKLHLLSSHPLRIHSDVIDIELIINNLYGFNFNFRIHPSTALKISSIIEGKKTKKYRGNKSKIRTVNEPEDFSKCSNRDYWLVDIQKTKVSIQSLRCKIIKFEYPLLNDIYKKYNGKIFFWLDNSFKVRIYNNLKNTCYWKENLILISKKSKVNGR